MTRTFRGLVLGCGLLSATVAGASVDPNAQATLDAGAMAVAERIITNEIARLDQVIQAIRLRAAISRVTPAKAQEWDWAVHKLGSTRAMYATLLGRIKHAESNRGYIDVSDISRVLLIAARSIVAADLERLYAEMEDDRRNPPSNPAVARARHESRLKLEPQLLADWKVLGGDAITPIAVQEAADGTTNHSLKPVQELQVVLEKAGYMPTRRLSAHYEFAIQGNPSPDQPATLQIRLFQGSDVDDQGRDSIERLNTFFGATGRERSAEASPMTIQLTNVVTVSVYESGWLFRDGQGRKVVIGNTNASEWKSKGIVEQLGIKHK